MRSDRERLLDIREAIAKIDQHSARDINAFADDEVQQVGAVIEKDLPALKDALEAILRQPEG